MGRLSRGEDGSVFFIPPSTGVFITWPSTGLFITWSSTGVFFSWPYLESPLYLILCWSLLHLTLPGVFVTRRSTEVFFTWPFLESSLLDPVLESSSLIQSHLQVIVSLSVRPSWAPPSLCMCVSSMSRLCPVLCLVSMCLSSLCSGQTSQIFTIKRTDH